MNPKRLQELLDEAIVDCYDEEEEFSGVLVTLMDNMNFPLQAKLLNDVVEVIGLDEGRSSLRRGIVAQVRKGEREHRVGLSELTFIDPDPASAEWLAMYHYWADILIEAEEADDE
jgi:hypothetical protein